MKATLKPHIRWMIRRDLPEVLRIDADSHTDANDEKWFLKCLGQRNCIGMIAEIREKVVAYMVYELHKGYLELLRFAVAPKWRRRDVGTAMIEKLQAKLSHQRRKRIRFSVDERELGGLLFLKSCGFEATAVARGDDFDEITMVYRLSSVAAEGHENW